MVSDVDQFLVSGLAEDEIFPDFPDPDLKHEGIQARLLFVYDGGGCRFRWPARRSGVLDRLSLLS